MYTGGCRLRFIPTPVGNTMQVIMYNTGITVHPHACGEHILMLVYSIRLAGSSPRLWGTLGETYYDYYVCRFIPTPVGNTATVCGLRSPRSVHPHACGEHGRIEFLQCFKGGSSPRLWGTRYIGGGGSGFLRFIPTPVGNTLIGPPALRVAWVHPHACGEHDSKNKSLRILLGSSPRLWGTPDH